jgi:hypothetical protein
MKNIIPEVDNFFMISPILFIVFFFILVLFYPAASLALSVSAWALKRRAGEKRITDKNFSETIDQKTDRLKEVVFKISVFIIFFFAAPLAVFYIINAGGFGLISW